VKQFIQGAELAALTLNIHQFILASRPAKAGLLHFNPVSRGDARMWVGITVIVVSLAAMVSSEAYPDGDI
jgi:hypothetical protein